LVQDSEIVKMKEQSDTYQMKEVCTNCGNRQVVTIPKGEEKPRRSTCSNCGCFTVECSVQWDSSSNVQGL